MISALLLCLSLPPALALKQCASSSYFCPDKHRLNDESVFDFHCLASEEPSAGFFCCQGYKKGVMCGGHKCCP